MEDSLSVPNAETPKWDGTVALKKVSWGIAKLLVAKYGAILAGPTAVSGLSVLGLTPEVVVSALPVAIFGGLVGLHDIIKLKTGWKFL